MSSKKARTSTLAAFVIPTAIFLALGGVGLPVLVPAVAAGIGTLVWGTRRVPGFWRWLFMGVAGGAVAGLLILGPGMRLAMRMVAIAEPMRVPEFSFEGTMFIVIGVGLMGGAIFGITVGLMGRLLERKWVAPGMAVLILATLMTSADLRSELLELGYGWAVNIPMFGAVFYGWAHVASRLAERFAATRRAPDLVDLGAPV